MVIRRAMTAVVALVVAATFAASGIAAQQAKPDNKQKRSKQEQAEIEQLVKLDAWSREEVAQWNP